MKLISHLTTLKNQIVLPTRPVLIGTPPPKEKRHIKKVELIKDDSWLR